MKKQIQDYMKYLASLDIDKMNDSEKSAEASKMLVRIQFYQHERIIHLMVTLAFAIMFIMSVVVLVLAQQAVFIVLTLLFLVLLVPYIAHYYFLENSVQKIYLYYYSLTMDK